MGKLIVAKSNRGAPDPIGLHDADGNKINPATVEKLEDLKTTLQSVLQSIYNAVDDLELTTENIKIEAGQINLNTDDLEEKVQSVRDQLDVLLSSRASESTLQSLLNALGEESGTNLLDEVQDILAKLDVALSTRASESTLIEVKNYLDTVETKLQTIIDKIDVNLSTRASEATLTEIKETIGQESGVTVLTKLQNIINQLNVELSTRASESTLSNIYGQLNISLTELRDAIKGTNNKDLSTLEEDIESILDTIGQESGITVLSKLKDLWDKLVELFNNGVAKVKLWDGINQANITADNKLQTISHGRNKISTLNSTVDTLGIGEEFIGEWEEILDYSTINILIYTDVESAEDGFMIEWSSDGISIDTNDTFTIVSGGHSYSFGAISRYFRIYYKNNSSTSQSKFRIQTILHPFNYKASSHRIEDIITGENDAELVKAILTGSTDGVYKNVKVSSDGRLEVSLTPPLTNTTVQILFHRQHSAINAGEWQEVLDYTIPEGYDLNVLAFEGQSETANERIRAIYKNPIGIFDCPTNTFTDQNSFILPRYATRLYACVTSEIGSGVNDTFTITYTNSKGITGRTGTVTFTKGSLIGTRLEVTLQTGDIGLIDITNITHSATGQAGAIQFCGYVEFLYLTLTSANTQYQTASIPLGGIVVLEGETIYLQYLSSTKTTYNRRLNLLGALVPK